MSDEREGRRAYRSPRQVTREEPDPSRGVRLEVTLRTGRGFAFEDTADLCAVFDVSAAATLWDVLDATLEVFGLDDGEHLAQLRVPEDRRVREPREWPPVRASDGVWTIASAGGDVDGAQDGAGAPAGDRTWASLLGHGQVAHLRFDFGDEWLWRVRVVPSPVPDARPLVSVVSVPSVRVVQYAGDVDEGVAQALGLDVDEVVLVPVGIDAGTRPAR